MACAPGIGLHLTARGREGLRAIIEYRNNPQRHAWRSRIVPLTVDDHATTKCMRQAGMARTAVWRWQEWFMQAALGGLLRDKTRPPRAPESFAPRFPPLLHHPR